MDRNWERFWSNKETIKREPLKCIVELVPVLKKRGSRTVLDLGCGSGRHVAYLAKKGFMAVGQDISANALAFASESLSKMGARNYVLINHDVTRLPFPDSSFDAVISTNAIHHNRLRDINRAVREIRRILKDRGVLFVNLTSRRKEMRGTGRRLEAGTYLTLSGPERGMVHHLFTRQEIKRTFSGFKILKLTPPSEKDRHWLLLAEKKA